MHQKACSKATEWKEKNGKGIQPQDNILASEMHGYGYGSGKGKTEHLVNQTGRYLCLCLCRCKCARTKWQLVQTTETEMVSKSLENTYQFQGRGCMQYQSVKVNLQSKWVNELLAMERNWADRKNMRLATNTSAEKMSSIQLAMYEMKQAWCSIRRKENKNCSGGRKLPTT